MFLLIKKILVYYYSVFGERNLLTCLYYCAIFCIYVDCTLRVQLTSWYVFKCADSLEQTNFRKEKSEKGAVVL